MEKNQRRNINIDSIGRAAMTNIFKIECKIIGQKKAIPYYSY